MKTKHLSWLVIGHTYIYEFLQENRKDKRYKDVVELSNTLGAVLKPVMSSQQEAIIYGTKASAIIDKLTTGKEIRVNGLVLGISIIMLLLEDDYFKGSKKMSVKRLVNDIYSKIERDNKDHVVLRNTNNIVANIYDYKGEY